MVKTCSFRKSSFLLLEVVIALALFALCVTPLIKPHFALHKLQRQKNLDAKRYIRKRLQQIEIKEHLFEGRYSFEQLQRGLVAKEYQLVRVDSTKRNHGQHEGLLLRAETADGISHFFVERVQ